MYSVSIGVAGLYLAAIAAVVILNCMTCRFCGLASPQHLFADTVLLVGVIWQCALFADLTDGDPDAEVGVVVSPADLVNVLDSFDIEPSVDADGIVASYVVILAFFSSLYVFKGVLLSKEYRKTEWVLLLCRVASACFIVYALFPGTTEQQMLGEATPGVIVLLASGILLMLAIALVSG